MNFRKEISKEELQQAITELKRVIDIANHFGVSRFRIRKDIKLYGLILPRIRTETEKAKAARKIVGIKNRGNNNPSKSEIARAKISAKKKDWWNKISREDRSKITKSHVTETMIKKCSVNKKLWWEKLTNEELITIKETFSKAQAHSENVSVGLHKSGVHTSVKGGNFYYRSSWELIIAERLDHNDIVTSYQYEKKVCRYYDYERGSYRWFRPDFIVTLKNSRTILLEVKPASLIKYNIVKLIGQWEWALNEGIEYAIVSEALVFDVDKFNKLLEEVYNGSYRSDTPERCGFV